VRRGTLGRRLEYYSHPKYGGEVPIYFSVEKALFSGVIGDTVLQDENLTKLKKLVDEALKNQSNLDWIPVIEVGFGYRSARDREDEDKSLDREIQVHAKRYWIAQKIGGHWIEASWNVTHWPGVGKKAITEIGDRLARSGKFTDLDTYDRNGTNIPLKTLKLPHTKEREDRVDNPTYYVAHDEALWAGLYELASRLDFLQDKIIELLGSAEHRNRLAASMQNLLPESTKAAGKEK